jgi:hypothetical protein
VNSSLGCDFPGRFIRSFNQFIQPMRQRLVPGLRLWDKSMAQNRSEFILARTPRADIN